MYLGLVWDTCKIHVKYQDTCILLECNRACKIRLGYIRIHQDTCILQDTRKIHQDTYPIGNVPKKDRKCAQTPSATACSHATTIPASACARVSPAFSFSGTEGWDEDVRQAPAPPSMGRGRRRRLQVSDGGQAQAAQALKQAHSGPTGTAAQQAEVRALFARAHSHTHTRVGLVLYEF